MYAEYTWTAIILGMIWSGICGYAWDAWQNGFVKWKVWEKFGVFNDFVGVTTTFFFEFILIPAAWLFGMAWILTEFG